MNIQEQIAKQLAENQVNRKLKEDTTEKVANEIVGKREQDIYLIMLGTAEAFQQIVEEGYSFHSRHDGIFGGHCSTTLLLNNVTASLLSLKANLITSFIFAPSLEHTDEDSKE